MLVPGFCAAVLSTQVAMLPLSNAAFRLTVCVLTPCVFHALAHSPFLAHTVVTGVVQAWFAIGHGYYQTAWRLAVFVGWGLDSVEGGDPPFSPLSLHTDASENLRC